MATAIPRLPDGSDIERQIHAVRGQRVTLDSELTQLYGVLVKRLTDQVQRNRERFPEDFSYQLTAIEFSNLKSPIATANLDHGGKQKRPWVFTEHSVAMLSSELRSLQAVSVNIAIMRVFVRMRRLIATPGELVTQPIIPPLAASDSCFVFVRKRRIKTPPPSSKPRMGF